MVEIQQTMIDETIPHIKFGCNTSVCKGACCTLAGGTGAPLLDEELEYIEQAFPVVKHLLPQDHLNTIEQLGLYEGEPGSYATMCFHNRACVFVFYENGIARCAFEKMFLEGTLTWRKPLSCHLFPIRMRHRSSRLLQYERIAECDPALERGEHENIFLSTFLQEPLIRALGSAWYQEFLRACERARLSEGLE